MITLYCPNSEKIAIGYKIRYNTANSCEGCERYWAVGRKSVDTHYEPLLFASCFTYMRV